MTTSGIKFFNSVTNCGVITTWPKGSVELGRYNIIYGWNGTGKTTLSRIFRSLELEAICPTLYKGGQPSFELTLEDGATLSSNKLEGWKTKVRVFNKDFIRDNLTDDTNDLKPVFYLGEEQGKAAKNLEIAEGKLKEATVLDTDANKELTAHRKKIEERDRAKASSIKNALGLPNYTITPLRKRLDGYIENSTDVAPFILSEKTLSDVMATARNGNDRKMLELLAVPQYAAEATHARVKEVLERNIIRISIEELDKNSSLKDWVDQGHELHRDRENCAFCASKISDTRREQLSQYFNDAYRELQDDILEATGILLAAIPKTQNHDAALLYQKLQEAYIALSKEFESAEQAYMGHTNNMMTLLDSKRERVNETIAISDLSTLKDLEDKYIKAVTALNDCIIKHNAHYNEFEKEREKAQEAAVSHFAAEYYAGYVKAKNEDAQGVAALEKTSQLIKEIKDECEALRIKVNAHDIALPNLNKLLHSFLGRDDLTVEANTTGYHIIRNSVQAENLSEGERTAIAFTYFIAKMQENKFDLSKGIIVIDDPISSLDSNSLYAAGAFIRCHLEEAHQLIVLTHNHQFFREIHGWIMNLSSENRKGHFMLKCETIGGARQAKLSKMDSVLKDYDSDYLFLCNQLFENRGIVFDGDNKDQSAKLMLLPNAARKVLETFLLFKFPDLPNRIQTLKLYSAIESLKIAGFDEEKLSMLDRLLNRASHGDDSKASMLDMLSLSETPKVINYVLDFIKAADEVHYNGLENKCGKK